jgi:hypothetical protein
MFQLKLLHATRLQSDYIHAAEGILAFHFVKNHNSYEAMHYNSGLTKTYFYGLETDQELSSVCRKLKHLLMV